MLIPIIAVFIGSVLSLLVNNRQIALADKSTRDKILQRMKHELTGILETPEDQGRYPSLKFHSGEIMLQSTVFTVSDHLQLINLTIQLVGEFQRLEIGINAASNIYGALIGPLSQPTLGNASRHLLQQVFGEKTTIEVTQETLNQSIKDLIDTSMRSFRPVARQLLEVVDNALASTSEKRKGHK